MFAGMTAWFGKSTVGVVALGDRCAKNASVFVIHEVCIAKLSRKVGWVSGMVLGLGMDRCLVAIA